MNAYERTRDFTRIGCIVGARQATYSALEQWFVCVDCGGSLSHRERSIDGAWIDWAECDECGCRDFISQRYYDRQCQEYIEILEKLPPELRALFPTREPLQMTAQEAIDQLYD